MEQLHKQVRITKDLTFVSSFRVVWRGDLLTQVLPAIHHETAFTDSRLLNCFYSCFFRYPLV